MNMKRLFRVATIVVALAMIFGHYTAPAIVAQQNTEGVVASPEMATAAAVAAYWTPERMASARPRDINPGTPSAAAGAVSGPDGPASLVAGNAPGEAPGQVVRRTGAAAPQAAGTLGFPTYPYPFTRQQAFPIAFFAGGYTQYPFSNNGKLFFTLGASNYVCSATSLTSSGGNQSLILTAGHCVSSGAGTWATNVLFSPGHRDFATPAAFDYDLNTAGSQRWPAYTMYTTSSWFNTGNLKRDFAMVVLRRRIPDGARLGNITGTQGAAWNWNADQQHFWLMGYPAAAQGVWPFTAFNGQRQWACQAPFARRVTEYSPTAPGPAPIAVGCDKTGGTSGGGWFLGFNDGLTTGYGVGAAYLNSVNSWRWLVPSQPRALHGPYFDTLFQTMWDLARVVVVP